MQDPYPLKLVQVLTVKHADYVSRPKGYGTDTFYGVAARVGGGRELVRTHTRTETITH